MALDYTIDVFTTVDASCARSMAVQARRSDTATAGPMAVATFAIRQGATRSRLLEASAGRMAEATAAKWKAATDDRTKNIIISASSTWRPTPAECTRQSVRTDLVAIDSFSHSIFWRFDRRNAEPIS